MLSSDSEKGVLRSNSPGDSEKGVLRSNSPSRKRALGDGEGDITNKRRRLGKSSVDFTTPQPSDGSGVVISSTPSPVSMPVSKAIPEGISKVDSNITRSRDATPELIRGVDDLFKEHKIQFPEGVSTQIFNLLHFENTMRRYNPESVGGQLSEKQVRDLFEALNQLDSLIGPDGDIRAIQDAKNILCEYVSRCVFRKVSENPANVSVISTILDQYLPQSEETFLKNQMHGLVLNYVESYLFEMANSHEGDRKVLSLAIGLLDSSGQHPSTYFSRLTGKMLGHLSFSNMSDDIFLTANQMLTDKLANVSSPLNQHAIWFRDKMKGMFLEEFVRRLELGLDESYFFRKPYVSNGDEGIKLAIALVGVSTQKPSAGLYRWTNLVVTNMPNILSKMSDDIFLTANQMLTDKLANVSSPLDQDAIWFRNKMEGMFLEEFQRRRVIKNLPRIK